MSDSIEQRVTKLEEQAALEKKLIRGTCDTVGFLFMREMKRSYPPKENDAAMVTEDAVMVTGPTWRGSDVFHAFLMGILVGFWSAVFIFN